MKPFVTALLASTLIASFAMAQQQPPPSDGAPPPPGERQGPPGGGGGGRGGPRGEGRGPGLRGDGEGPGMMGGGGMGMGLGMARDPSLAGIASVVAAADLRRPRGADAAIAYFEKTLPEAKSPAVQRAIRLQLVDLYKAVGKQDQALDQLKTLMTAEPGPNDLQQPAPPPPGAGPNR